MSSQLARHLFVGCIGCGLGWLTHSTLHQRDEQTPAVMPELFAELIR